MSEFRETLSQSPEELYLPFLPPDKRTPQPQTEPNSVIIIGKHEVTDRITPDFRNHFNQAIQGAINHQELESLRKQHPAQYNCALILLSHALGKTRTDMIYKQKLLESTVIQRMQNYGRAIPGLSELIRAIFGSQLPLTGDIGNTLKKYPRLWLSNNDDILNFVSWLNSKDLPSLKTLVKSLQQVERHAKPPYWH